MGKNKISKKQSWLITFIGMDGAGKTTLAKELIKELYKEHVSFDYIYNRYVPVITKPLIALGKMFFYSGRNEKTTAGKTLNYRKRVLGRPIISFFYNYLTMFDYWLQMWWRIMPSRLRGRNIICDRYLHDTLIDLAIDLGFSMNRMLALNKWLRFFPRTNMIFFVDVPEAVALQRKNDILSIEFLQARLGKYRNIAETLDISLIDGTLPIADNIALLKINILGVLKKTV